MTLRSLKKETLATADYQYVKLPRFDLLDMKVWLKEENICAGFAPGGE